MFYTNQTTTNQLLEAYYGKSKEFLTIEKELDKIIKTIKSNSERINDKIKIKNIKGIAKSDSVTTIEKLFKKIFKLEDFYLCFYTAFPLGILFRPDANAFTWGKGFNYFRDKDTSKRVDSTDMVMGVNIDIGFIQYFNITAEELLAIILHEIGHNMSASIFSLLSNIAIITIQDQTGNIEVSPQLSAYATTLGLTLKDFIFSSFTDVNKDIEEGIEKNPIFQQVLNKVSAITVNLSILAQGFGVGFIHLIKLIKSPALILMILNPRNIFGYSEEKYADSFASSYGYAVPLSSALSKFDTYPGVKSVQIVQNIPVLNWSFDFIRVSFKIINGIFDEHPQNASRIMAQLAKLKRDMNDPSIDPRIKKDILMDINKLETFINTKYISFCNETNKRNIFTWLYNWLVIKVFKGNIDVRELFKIFDVEE